MASVEGRTLAEAIERAVDPVVRAHGLQLVDLEVARGGRRSLVRFAVDAPGGVTIDDCRRFSEEVGDLLDVAELLPGSYDLEVSSPGLDRELGKERELRWAVGKAVRVFTREAVEGHLEHAGRLAAVGTETLTLEVAAGLRLLPRSLVTRARLDQLPPAARPGRRRR